MYYQGSSDGLQTLYLMNPSYSGSDTQPQPSTVIPHAPPPQHFMGIPLSHDPSRPSPSSQDHHHHIPAGFHYNLWGLADHHHQPAFGNLLNNQPNKPQPQPTPRGLSLSLTPNQTGFDRPIISSSNNNNPGDDRGFGERIISTNFDDDDGDDVKSLIMGSKYLKAAQELLDEVVSVGKGSKIEGPEDKAKTITIRSNGDESGGVAHELTTAQRQEIQMKKTKLNSMLDEVDQRYKQYHDQMQIIVTSFQQVAGNGSAKSYTQLALKTILKQFRCLKNTISSQIKALCKSLGEEDNPGGQKMDGSRLKLVDHGYLQQQRALQQLGMMQNNNSAWRAQRGLPERAVSVLRAWLFEHFLHPYPKDSDKHKLAKQTGLTRSQVSNWFINARVRLWKPMVEDMYLEEIKNQETNPDNNSAKHGLGPGPDSNSEPSNLHQTNLNTLQAVQNSKPTLNLVPTPSEISASTMITKSTTRNNMENPNKNNPKKPRNDNSPCSMLSVDMERDQPIVSKGFSDNIMFTNADQNMENYLSSSGFSSRYGISIGEFERQQIPSGFDGNNNNNNNNNNNFSLTLALPPSGNYSQGTQQQNFLPDHRNFEFGTRIEPIESSGRVNGINNRSDGAHPEIGNYEILDFQNRKPFSSQL